MPATKALRHRDVPGYALRSRPGRSYNMSVQRLPVQLLPPPAAASDVLFLVMSSVALEERAHVVFDEPWCRAAQCVFFTDGDFRRRPKQMWIVTLPGLRHPSAAECCARAGNKTEPYTSSDFCLVEWRQKLSAQYRFLPALRWAKERIAAAALQTPTGGKTRRIGRDVRWVALIDDDSYVYTNRFLQLLGWHDPMAEAIYMGDFLVRYPGWKPSDFACGGGGSILSIRALQAMQINRCISDFSTQCLMSDWMVGHCTASPYVTAPIHRAKEYACDSCLLGSPQSADAAEIRWRILHNDCFFLQNVRPEILEAIPCGGLAGKYAPAIVHGLYIRRVPAPVPTPCTGSRANCRRAVLAAALHRCLYEWESLSGARF